MKYVFCLFFPLWVSSPSMRREWIEILSEIKLYPKSLSPSMRREWIEMRFLVRRIAPQYASPSMRREWIEMILSLKITSWNMRLPPCGGSGLKSWQTCQKIHLSNVSLHAEGVD